MALTWSQIFRNVDTNRAEKAASTVTLKQMKLGLTRKNEPIAEAQVFSIDKDAKGQVKRNRYKTEIKWVSDKHVMLSCSCYDFMYRWEYALAKRGASVIRYCNGEHPDAANPRLIPGCCKHLVHLYGHLEDKGKVRQVQKWMRLPKAARDKIMKERNANRR